MFDPMHGVRFTANPSSCCDARCFVQNATWLELTIREGESAVRQTQRLIALIGEAVEAGSGFELRAETICELNALATDGTMDHPGQLRTRDLEIFGSQHEPPPWREVAQLVDELCEHVNEGDHDPLDVAAYVLWRLNWIHPFEEGNGRTARAVSYLVLCAFAGQALPGEHTVVELLVWQKRRYYRALEAADKAWREGRMDVSAMRSLLEALLEKQLVQLASRASLHDVKHGALEVDVLDEQRAQLAGPRPGEDRVFDGGIVAQLAREVAAVIRQLLDVHYSTSHSARFLADVPRLVGR